MAVKSYCWLYEECFEHWHSIFVNFVTANSVQKNSLFEICLGCIWNSLFLFVRSLTFELKERQLNPTVGFMNNAWSSGIVY